MHDFIVFNKGNSNTFYKLLILYNIEEWKCGLTNSINLLFEAEFI